MSIEDTLSDFIKRPKCSLSLIDRDLIEFEIFEKSGDKHSNASSSRGEQEQLLRSIAGIFRNNAAGTALYNASRNNCLEANKGH